MQTKKISNTIYISAKNKTGINDLKQKLIASVNTSQLLSDDTIITNIRHFEELQLSLSEINTIIEGIKINLTGDLLSVNIRQALYHLGSITGEITSENLLDNIFGKFCIGK
tara:strand:- start:383 stop:715 length:333 start_codon:yes stop_codon:yes gene_type:complete